MIKILPEFRDALDPLHVGGEGSVQLEEYDSQAVHVAATADLQMPSFRDSSLNPGLTKIRLLKNPTHRLKKKKKKLGRGLIFFFSFLNSILK